MMNRMSGQFKTFYSHQTERLTEQLLHCLPNDKGFFHNQPFGQCHIIVPNSGMQRYLELQIARHFGICSHIQIGYLGHLLWQLYLDVLPETKHLPALDERYLTFRLLDYFEKNQQLHRDLQTLSANYPHSKQRYQFARQVAKLLRLYLMDRPDVIDDWQQQHSSHLNQHPHAAWQQSVFEQLALGQYSRHTLQQRFHKAILSTTTPLPSTLHIFGFHTIPPTQLMDLQALSEVCEVYFYTFNPSVEYWQDLVPEAVKTAKSLTNEDEAALFSIGNPLLASWGQAGKFYLETLNDYDFELLDEENENSENSSNDNTYFDNTLTALQATICHLDEQMIGLIQDTDKQPAISLNACAGIRREVEVLYDNLLDLLENNEQVTPSDILVIVPNLRDYAPHIQAIFSQQAIPFSLANQTAAEADSDTQAFIALLNVIAQQFSAQSLFECISEHAIRQALNLEVAHLNQIREWLLNHHFSGGYHDDSHGRDSSLEKLLDQLLLASVGDTETLIGQRQASTAYHPEQQETLAYFCQIVQQFLPFARMSTRSQTLPAWFKQLSRLAEVFLPEKPSGSPAVHERLIAWFDNLAGSHEHTIAFEIIHADILSLLESEELHGPFLSGGVSFCAVMPMRSIPSKVIALLGMNQDFPAITPTDPLDLRQANPLWSDHNPYKESRYFFLETVMAARQYLYLSYTGFDEKSGEKLPPSSLVSELVEYIERQYPGFEQQITRNYPLQGFMEGTEKSYQTLYRTDLLPPPLPHTTSADEELPALPTQWQVNDLVNAICSPLHFYLSKRLHAADLERLPELLKAHPYMGKDNGLDNWKRQQISMVSALDGDDEPLQLQATNLAAPEIIDSPLRVQMQEQFAELYTAVKPLVTQPHISLSADILLDYQQQQHRCLFQSSQLTNETLWQYHTGTRKGKHLIKAWVQHILLNCLPPEQYPTHPRSSLMLTLDKDHHVQKTAFKPFDNITQAHCALSDILHLAATVFATPYALLWSENKQWQTKPYHSVHYPLYSGLEEQLIVDETALNSLLSPIAKTLEAHNV